ncbi:polymer-forming cytoskeletal protein [Paenibacillus sp. GCM10028914]|uniref:polymer-forming cytoskeletal protein n=1 Tax=Paenibacillus sp. GCM10028914 TaxID=3273416 RepID=UPI0036227D90
MEERVHDRQDLHIAGAGVSAGGVYGKVQLDGMGSIRGDLDCIRFVGNGNVSVKGSLTSETVRIHGNGTVDGPVDVHELHVGGSAKLKGHLRCHALNVNGKSKVQGEVKASKIAIGGFFNALHIQSETIEVKGSISVEGVMHSDTIDIRLFDRSEVQQISANFIKVRKKGKRIWEQLTFSFRPALLTTRIIEGSLIDVEHTEADIIRGNRVVLGPGCKVRLVEYVEELIQDPSAEVGEVRLI